MIYQKLLFTTNCNWKGQNSFFGGKTGVFPFCVTLFMKGCTNELPL